MFSMRFHAPPLEGGVPPFAAVLQSRPAPGDLQTRCELFFNCSENNQVTESNLGSFIKAAAKRACLDISESANQSGDGL